MSADREAPTAAVRTYKPYFTTAEIAQLGSINANVSSSRVEDRRQQACAFILAVSAKLGFPRRTAATAQLLYQRFFLFFPLRDFSSQDVSMAALLVASKLEDTLKKLKDIQVAGHFVKAALDAGTIPPEPDLHMIDYERNKLIGIERLILETISFSFNLHFGAPPDEESRNKPPVSHDVFSYIVKVAQHMKLSKEFTKIAFQLGRDAHRTLMPLSYPAHVIALACLYLASNLDIDTEGAKPDTAFDHAWAKAYCAELQDIQEVALAIIDVAASAPLYLNSNSRSANTSPFDTSPAESGRAAMTGSTGNWENTLFQLKIQLRKREDEAAQQRQAESTNGDGQQHQPPPAKRSRTESGKDAAPLADQYKPDRNLLGRDDMTILFRFDQ